MPIDLKTPPPTKELLERGNIRTMKKDIASLREADSLQEKQKISNIQITVEPAVQPAKEPIRIVPEKSGSLDSVINDSWTASQKNRQQEVKTNLQQSAKQEVKPDTGIDADIKLYATETEKQQIFLLQSRKTALEKQVTGMGLQEGVSLQDQKTKLLGQKAEAQQKLSAMPQEVEQGTEQDEEAKKKRWAAEGELKKMDEAIKNLDEKSRQSQISQNNIKKEITDIDNSLKTMATAILQREKAKEQQLQQLVEKKPEVPAAVKEAPKMVSEKVTPLAQKPAFAQSSVPAMEKLAKATEIEEKQRLKFMEDVEKWIASSENHDNK